MVSSRSDVVRADRGGRPGLGARADEVGLLQRWSVFQRDVAGTALLGLVVAAIAWLGGDAGLERVSGARPTAVGWAMLATTIAPLAWRRVRPDVTMTVSGLATGAFYFLGFSGLVGPVGVLFALYALSAYSPNRVDGVASLAVSMVFVTASFAVTSTGDLGAILASYGLTSLLFVTAWGLGEATRLRRRLEDELRERAEAAEAARRMERDRVAAEERNRIARELHDVVAHTVSVLVVQAGAGRHVARRQPERAAEVLEQVETAGREALGELRRVLGVLRAGPEDRPTRGPQPRIADLEALVARLREAGLPVVLELRDRRRGGCPLPGSVELSTYRIVQEALTNVMKHAGRVDEVVVDVDVDEGRVVLAVRDDGRGVPIADAVDYADVPGGQGLVGMRERVDMLGGRIEAGPRRGGGYRVRAELPLATASVPTVPAPTVAVPTPAEPPEAVGAEVDA